ncbi:MAG: hypothetical protein BWY73_00571 [candidate division TA06 bacterium ADurb.Bin417]|uniref:Uncharacterized protein n=1 Tax=candidate division TA06 bacterium ADurb.Bin417 TaxID=1852828 RepID=A0A1V5MI63_UNCT6|nr:MAG: hypothetical protein BWY73_00571 [candidate division TA06 bacterium ADurb.Bin417]
MAWEIGAVQLVEGQPVTENGPFPVHGGRTVADRRLDLQPAPFGRHRKDSILLPLEAGLQSGFQGGNPVIGLVMAGQVIVKGAPPVINPGKQVEDPAIIDRLVKRGAQLGVASQPQPGAPLAAPGIEGGPGESGQKIVTGAALEIVDEAQAKTEVVISPAFLVGVQEQSAPPIAGRDFKIHLVEEPQLVNPGNVAAKAGQVQGFARLRLETGPDHLGRDAGGGIHLDEIQVHRLLAKGLDPIPFPAIGLFINPVGQHSRFRRPNGRFAAGDQFRNPVETAAAEAVQFWFDQEVRRGEPLDLAAGILNLVQGHHLADNIKHVAQVFLIQQGVADIDRDHQVASHRLNRLDREVVDQAAVHQQPVV